MIIRKMLEINCFLSKRDILSKNIKSNVLFSLLLIEVAQVELWEPPAFFSLAHCWLYRFYQRCPFQIEIA